MVFDEGSRQIRSEIRKDKERLREFAIAKVENIANAGIADLDAQLAEEIAFAEQMKADILAA